MITVSFTEKHSLLQIFMLYGLLYYVDPYLTFSNKTLNISCKYVSYCIQVEYPRFITIQ